MLKARMSALALALMLPGVAACVGGPPIVTAQSAACSALIPNEWAAGVAPAPLPNGDTVGDWVAFADAQTGKLDQANGRTRDTIGIISRCEERDAAAIKHATRRKFLGIF